MPRRTIRHRGHLRSLSSEGEERSLPHSSPDGDKGHARHRDALEDAHLHRAGRGQRCWSRQHVPRPDVRSMGKQHVHGTTFLSRREPSCVGSGGPLESVDPLQVGETKLRLVKVGPCTVGMI